MVRCFNKNNYVSSLFIVQRIDAIISFFQWMNNNGNMFRGSGRFHLSSKRTVFFLLKLIVLLFFSSLMLSFLGRMAKEMILPNKGTLQFNLLDFSPLTSSSLPSETFRTIPAVHINPLKWFETTTHPKQRSSVMNEKMFNMMVRNMGGMEKKNVPYWNLTQENLEDIQKTEKKEKEELVQQLSRSFVRPGVTFDPELGVPIAETYFRLKKQMDLEKQRPATKAEINETLDNLKFLLKEETKTLPTGKLIEWKKSPLTILLVSTWRSGSTFLGQFLNQYPAVFQHYEPLSFLGVRQATYRERGVILQTMNDLFSCKYESNSKYMNFSNANLQDIQGHNRLVWKACSSGPNQNACKNPSFLSTVCKLFPLQLVKTVRLRLNETVQWLLSENRENIRVIYLIRDPRATMNSRLTSVKWCQKSYDCISPVRLCADLENDLKAVQMFKKKFPKNFLFVKYEDVALKPVESVKNILQFLNLDIYPDLVKYVKQHTSVNADAPWSTTRNSSERIEQWKKTLPNDVKKYTTKSCHKIFKFMSEKN